MKILAALLRFFLLALIIGFIFTACPDTVKEQPVITITVQPAPTTNVTAGSISGSLSVAASVTQGAVLSYQWFSNTVDSKIGGTAIGANGTNASYPIPVALTAGTYYYFCELSTKGSVSVRSSVAVVNVAAQEPVVTTATITITSQPASITNVTVGSITGVLSVTANFTQSTALRYQWFSNTFSDNTSGTAIQGATLSNYTIPLALIPGTYYYFCELSAAGDVAPVRSTVAIVNVASVITITVQPTPTTNVTAGKISGILSVGASVTQGSVLSYQWFSNTVDSNTGGTAIGANGANASYPIPGTLTAGTYYYFCELSATVGAVPVRSSVAKVIVTAPVNAANPVITSQPVGGTFTDIGTLTVMAYVADNGQISYQWYQNTVNSTIGGNLIPGATEPSYTYTDRGTFYYYVVVINTILDNGDGGNKQAITTSNVVSVVIRGPQWARTVSIDSSGSSRFNAVASDAYGNVYAAGYISSGNCIFGAGVSVTGISSSGNVVLVKYDANGTALWARTVSSASSNSYFNAVAVDASGNVYAAGYIQNGSYTFGAGASVTGINSNSNVLLVKYDANGTAQWAQTVSSASNSSNLYAVTVDASGNVYVAGNISGGSCTFSTGVEARNYFINNQVLLVRYTSDGIAQWARTLTDNSGINPSYFFSAAVDAFGNVYAAGYMYGGNFTFGTGVEAIGYYSFVNLVLVKYNANGIAQWAQTVSPASNMSSFAAVAVDVSGDVYAAGYVKGGVYTFGAGVSTTLNYNIDSFSGMVLVKYDANGTAQWARTVSFLQSSSFFNSVAVDAFGNVYAAGYMYGGNFTFGTGVSITGILSSGNVALVKYDTNGTAQWAQTVSSASNNSYSNSSCFNAVAVDASGNVFAAGYMGNGSFTFGSGVSATGSSQSNNAVLVKYGN